jgi:hypothetical protein
MFSFAPTVTIAAGRSPDSSMAGPSQGQSVFTLCSAFLSLVRTGVSARSHGHFSTDRQQ